MKQKSQLTLGHIYISMIEYPKYYWYVPFGHKRLCYERATAGTFILNLLYSVEKLNDFEFDAFLRHLDGDEKRRHFQSNEDFRLISVVLMLTVL